MRLLPAAAIGFTGLLVADAALAARPGPGPAAPAREAANETTEAPHPAPTPRPIRLVANEVVEKWWAAFRARAADTAQRVSVAGGLVGLGPYNPRGGADYGSKAPPRHLFPRVGGGNSLNVDPTTGHSYFTNTP